MSASVHEHSIENLRRPYDESGFALIRDAVPTDVVDELRTEADRLLEQGAARGGARNLLHRSERLRRESEQGAVAGIAGRLLGPASCPTKLTLFDKTMAANWLVGWHQDLTITVRERQDAEGFSNWSLKEGVLHVRPPVGVLRSVVALRLHLDDTPSTNGALRVLPGSHRSGLLTLEQIRERRQDTAEVICELASGGVMVMSPLLLHASSKSRAPTRRRVLHFEYSAISLPGGLHWA